MSGWAGFSDEELRRIQQKDSAGPAAAVRGRKPPPSGRSRQQLQRERALQLAGAQSLPLGQQLSQPPPKELPKPAARPGAPGGGQEAPPAARPGAPGGGQEAPPAARPGAPGGGQEAQQKSADMEPNENHQPEETSREIKELEKQEAELRERSRLELLQLEQKLMEERNKRKKALLTKTIAEKSKQTQAEAVKLRRIQKELQALDDMVSNDIGILRGKIEEASWDYTAARKRYEKAEAEYVTAKLDLHRKTELKEQLTEHLCAIIQQNELRKAHKLEELMQQLQVEATEEEEEGRRNCAQRSGQEAVEGGAPPAEEEEAMKEGGEQKTLENCGEAEPVSS
ncbi:RAB6-interacting golgin [Nematolebias whitei]|uniref:RAB6-interacting golgin n=1 Tax=Nematolebias whitei TaxID=451745 RepID=UPI00189B837A|nr:RAB6-interacting golgin [Nematolebias whitei]